MNYEQIIVVVLAVCGVLKWVFGIGALFGIAFAGKWFHNFRNRVDDNSDTCESINDEGGLRDRIETLETQMELLTKYLEKEHNITIGSIDQSQGKTTIDKLEAGEANVAGGSITKNGE